MKRTLLVALLLAGCGSGDSRGTPAPVLVAKLDVGSIVFMGDSIIQLWPLDEFLSGAVNAGASGEDSWQMRDRFQKDVIERKPRTVVILAGTNDIRDRDSADPEHLFAMVKLAREAGIRVIVGTVPPMDINMGAYPEVEKQLVIVLNDKIRKGAVEHGYAVADYFPAFLLDGSMNTALYADAFLHPNKAGYEAMWAKLEPLLH
jgi:alpha-L-fucosidase